MRNLQDDPISLNEIIDLIDNRQTFQQKVLQDTNLFINIKIQAANILIEDYEKNINLKTSKNNYDE
jgi:hypothetical protein